MTCTWAPFLERQEAGIRTRPVKCHLHAHAVSQPADSSMRSISNCSTLLQTYVFTYNRR